MFGFRPEGHELFLRLCRSLPNIEHRGFLMKEVLVLAHRGFRATYPENTLLAFRKGFAAGADGLECDVQKTKDGHFVIIHDGTVDRTAKDGSMGEIASMTLHQLKKIDMGNRQKIPELVEFLKAIPAGKFVNIELKDETLTGKDAPELCRIFLTHIPRANLLVSSFDHSLLHWFKKQKVSIGFLADSHDLSLGLPALFVRIIRMRPDSMNLPIQIFDTAWGIPAKILVRIFRSFGTKIFFWTVNTGKQFNFAYRYGDGIIGDDAAYLRMQMKNVSVSSR